MEYHTILREIPHSKHYLERYISFIDSIQLRSQLTTPVERHHICPSSLFPPFKDGRRFAWNIIRLTPRQHFLAHWMLWKAYRGKAMAFAFHAMSLSSKFHQRTQRIPARLYEKLRIDMREPKSAETKAKMKNSAKLRWTRAEERQRLSDYASNRTDTHRAKLGTTHRGKTISPEMRAKQSAALSGIKNPRAMVWEIEWEDGTLETINSLKTWCVEHGLKYTTVYMRLRNGDNETHRDGFRVLSKQSSRDRSN